MSCSTCSCAQTVPSGNSTYAIPVKIGEPLSNACQRSVTIGSIPEVVRFPGFSLVNGATVQNAVSDAGICNMSSFFKTRSGCYQSWNARVASVCC